jgi:hypothetical protein
MSLIYMPSTVFYVICDELTTLVGVATSSLQSTREGHSEAICPQ